jgi:hypothetical protein
VLDGGFVVPDSNAFGNAFRSATYSCIGKKQSIMQKQSKTECQLWLKILSPQKKKDLKYF